MGTTHPNNHFSNFIFLKLPTQHLANRLGQSSPRVQLPSKYPPLHLCRLARVPRVRSSRRHGPRRRPTPPTHSLRHKLTWRPQPLHPLSLDFHHAHPWSIGGLLLYKKLDFKTQIRLPHQNLRRSFGRAFLPFKPLHRSDFLCTLRDLHLIFRLLPLAFTGHHQLP